MQAPWCILATKRWRRFRRDAGSGMGQQAADIAQYGAVPLDALDDEAGSEAPGSSMKSFSVAGPPL